MQTEDGVGMNVGGNADPVRKNHIHQSDHLVNMDKKKNIYRFIDDFPIKSGDFQYPYLFTVISDGMWLLYAKSSYNILWLHHVCFAANGLWGVNDIDGHIGLIVVDMQMLGLQLAAGYKPGWWYGIFVWIEHQRR